MQLSAAPVGHSEIRYESARLLGEEGQRFLGRAGNLGPESRNLEHLGDVFGHRNLIVHHEDPAVGSHPEESVRSDDAPIVKTS